MWAVVFNKSIVKQGSYYWAYMGSTCSTRIIYCKSLETLDTGYLDLIVQVGDSLLELFKLLIGNC